MNQRNIMNMTITDAKKSARWVELDIHNRRFGKTGLRQVSQLKDIIDIISAGWSDLDSDWVDAERLERTGIELPESGLLSPEADYILSDWINVLNLGDNKITITPTKSRKFICFIHGKQVA